MTKKIRKIRRLAQGRVYDLYGELKDREEIAEFFKRNLPCIIKGSMENWPARILWKPPFLRLFELIRPQRNIKVAVSATSFSGVNTSFIDMTFYEFITRPANMPYFCYMAQCPVKSSEGLDEQQTLSPLLMDLKKPRFLPAEDFNVHFWMNTKQVVSDFHYDSYQNFLSVIYGSKTVELIPPSKLLNSYPIENEAYNHSLFDHTGDFTVTLFPGDILYIPEGWWHKVTSSPYTIGLSFTWNGIDQQTLSKDSNGELDFYIVRNAMKRLALKEIEKNIEKLVSSVNIDHFTLKHIKEGDSEFIKEQFEVFGVLSVVYHAPPSSVRRLLSKLKKYGGIIEFLIKLSPEEGFLIARKLDEYETIGMNEFSNELFDGSALSRKFQRLLMKKKQKTIRNCINTLVNHIF